MATLIQLQRRYHQAFASFSTYLFLPLSWLLTKLHISPAVISIASVVAMSGVIFSIRTSLTWAVFFILLAMLLDWLDEPLALYQHKASDKGKLLDVICDTTSFILFMVGLTYGGLVSVPVAILLACAMVVTKVLRVMWVSPQLETDWLFKPMVGLVPTIVGAALYVAFIASVWLMGNIYLQLIAILALLILVADCLVSYRRISKLTP